MKDLNAIIEHLKKTIEEVSLGNFTVEQLAPNMALIDDIGLDSLDYASVMLSGEDFVGCKVNENKIDWREIRTIGQLADLLYQSQ